MKYAYETNKDSKNFTPNRRAKAVFGMTRTIAGITIHHWGTDNQKHDNVVNYLCTNSNNTSAHEVISAGRVTCIVNHLDIAHHAGSARGNCTTIGLELRPEMTAQDFETAAQRVADIRDFYNKDLPLIPHKQWKNTACPGRWEKQLTRLSTRANELRKDATPPAPAKQYHTVKSGDTAWAVANKNKITLDKMVKLNPGKNLSKINPGDKLRIK